MITYQITDLQYFTTNPDKFLLRLYRSIKKHRPDFICYRDKSETNQKATSKKIRSLSKKTRTKFLINQNLPLALKYRFYGIHLTSKQFNLIKKAKRHGLFVVISTHNEKEIQKVLRLGADFVTYSPVFPTPNKGAPKGVQNLKKVASRYKNRVIALGGITSEKEVKEISQAKIFGFASIRYFL